LWLITTSLLLLLDRDALSPFGTSCLSEMLRESGSTLLSDYALSATR